MKNLSFVFVLTFFFVFFTLILNSATVELYGNYHTMGVIITLNSGEDPENDAIANIEYRPSGGTYQEGFPATRTSDVQFAGSIFWLQPGNSYDVKVTFSDVTTPALDGIVITQTASTRPDPVWIAATKSYYVSPTGSGTLFTLSNPGALSDAVGLVQAGEEIVLLGGTYYEGEFDLVSSGIAGAPVTIRGQNGETAILDGSDPSSFSWNNEGNGIYSTTLNVPNTQLVVAAGSRLYDYGSYGDLQNLIWGLDGFYVDGSTLYVKIQGVNPADIEMVISNKHYAFDMTLQDYIYFRDLTFRYYGQGSWAKALYFFSSRYDVVDNCIFAINNNGIGIKYSSDQITVQNCEFYDDTDMWDWDAMKASGFAESTCLGFYDPVYGRGHVIRDNIFHDCMDGMSPGNFYYSSTTQELDIYNNLIYNCGDDGISADGYVSNVRVWNNTIHDVLVGISFAPIENGPAYAIRNLIYNTGYGNSIYTGMSFKFNSGYSPSGAMYLFHNTCDAVISGVDGIEFRVPGDWELVYSRNNAFTGNNYAFSFIESGGNRTLNMDYDNLYTSNASKFAYWHDSQSNYYTSLSQFQTATNLELNGINEIPQFASPSTGNYSLQSSSDLINAGIHISGINDDFVDTAPDIGAFEYQTPLAVEFVNISASSENCDVLLKWSAINNDNSKIFLERSNDGISWQNIADLFSQSGGISVTTNSFYDNNPGFGKAYYRLKTVETDGTVFYSKVVFANIENCFPQIFPNPVSDELNIGLNNSFDKIAEIVIFDINGKTVYIENRINASKKIINLSFLSPGIYLTDIRTMKGFRYYERIVR